VTAVAPSICRRGFITGAAAIAAAPPALAHRSKTVLTTVEWNARSGAIEVIHRMHPHDAEMALAALGGGGQPDLTEVRDQARLLIYVEDRFSLAGRSGLIPLSAVGVEAAGVDDLLVYRESRQPAPADELLVEDRLFRDVFDEQTNLVNVRMSKRVRTLIFAGRDGPKRASGLL
jgi:hypothetical protein